ncbi:hypothetical protein [Romboutsia lituseburensis]|nr:hypothetical protein [Romboutsia lituseburensis]MCR8744326.1 hypothetical protein [Romboutsia lituseburensis]
MKKENEVSQTVKENPQYEESGEYKCDFSESRKFRVNSYEDGRCY